MRILINAVSANTGGARTYVEHLAQELTTHREHEFIWYISPDQEVAFCNSPSHFRVVMTSAACLSPLKRFYWDQVILRRIVKEIRPDLLYSTGNFAMFWCPARQLLLVSQSKPFSTLWLKTVHSGYTLSGRVRTRLRRWLICASSRMSDIVMTPTQAMLEDLRRFTRVDGQRALVNPFGVATPPHEDGNLDQCPGGGWPKNPPRIRLIYVSLYSDHKNLGTVLKALPLLNRNGAAKFVLITTVDPAWEGASWTVTYKDDLALARRADVMPWVEFLGLLNPRQIQELYREGDIFVFPSLCESFGYPMVEAMAHGLPIVASDTPVNREICGEAAVYFSPFDPEDLAVQVHRVASNFALRQRLLTEADQRAHARFTWPDHVRRILEASQRLPSGSKR